MDSYAVKESDINPQVRSLALNTELHIAGEALYLGLRRYHITTCEESADLFYFLYQTTIGIERLMKINYRLIEARQDSVPEMKFRHNLTKLHDAILGLTNTVSPENEKGFIKMLTEFYKDSRYANLDNSSSSGVTPQQLFINYTASLGLKTDTKVRLGQIIQGVIKSQYTILKDMCTKLGVFTDELSYGSNGGKLFYATQIYTDIFMLYSEEDRAYNEFITALLAFNKESRDLRTDIRTTPLGESVASMHVLTTDIYTELETLEIIRSIRGGVIPQDLVDLVNDTYNNLDATKERSEKEMRLGIYDALVGENLIEAVDE